MNYCLILIVLCCFRGENTGKACCTQKTCRPELPCRPERLICETEETDVVCDVEATSVKISETPEIVYEL